MWRVVLMGGCLFMGACAPRLSPDEIGNQIWARRLAEQEAARKAAPIVHPEDVSRHQAIQAAGDAGKAWTGCVIKAAGKLADSAQPETVILQRAFGACTAEETAASDRWFVALGPEGELKMIWGRQMTASIALPLISQIRQIGRGSSAPATTTTSPAKAKEVAI